MPSLVDIVPLTKTVDIRGTAIEVVGVGLDTIGELIEPREIQKAMSEVRFDGLGLLSVLPITIRRLVAACVGKMGDAATEEAVRKLNAVDQLALVEAMIEVSFPGGVTPFVNRLGRVVGIDDLMGALSAMGARLRAPPGNGVDRAAPSREPASSSSSPSTS
jgi:hypothetical protein